MSRGYNPSNFRWLIFWLLALIQCSSHLSAEEGISAVKKSIKSSDGDIIDCVDIYKQPTFSDPLFKNHKIQIKPSSYPEGIDARNSSSELFQSWHQDGECPLGTIPILRIPERSGRFITSSNSSNAPLHEFAIASLPIAKYFGARGTFNIWIPKVANAEVSLSKMSVKSGPANAMNAMQAGWRVKGGDNNARFFIAWTRDGFRSTGCSNLDCPGFVQTSRRFALGGTIKPVSIYGGKQFQVNLSIKKDFMTGAWLLFFQNQFVGYWPKSIFTSLADSATTVSYGGEVISNPQPGGNHTTTQMGSGHFAGEAFGKAAYIGSIQFIDESRTFKNADGLSLPAFVTKETCYNLDGINSPQFGPTVYFGGPGLSPSCR